VGLRPREGPQQNGMRYSASLDFMVVALPKYYHHAQRRTSVRSHTVKRATAVVLFDEYRAKSASQRTVRCNVVQRHTGDDEGDANELDGGRDLGQDQRPDEASRRGQ
jgi:hypothetical protein